MSEGAAWFKDSVKIIQLRSTSTRDESLFVLGVLNASTASYWLRGRFKGTGNVRELWEERIQIDEKLGGFPVPQLERSRIALLADALTECARQRAAQAPSAVIEQVNALSGSLDEALAAAREKYTHLTHRMVALQEELDWTSYVAYGLVDVALVDCVDDIESLCPGHRPFEIVHARTDAVSGEDEKSLWWSRHGHERSTEVPAAYSDAQRTRLLTRVELIESDARLALIESPSYKRRWNKIDWQAEVRNAAGQWLANRLENLFAHPAAGVPGEHPSAPRPYRLEEIAAAFGRDPAAVIVAGLWSSTGHAVDVARVVEDVLLSSALPDNPNRLYTKAGLVKRGQWSRVWHMQEQEDQWQWAAARARTAGDDVPPRRILDPRDPLSEVQEIPQPRPFESADFTSPSYFLIRGSLDVPRERFILFGDLSTPRYGWNGWRGRDRALAQVEAFTLAENDPQQPLPVPTAADPRRCGVTYGLWESLPDVRRWGSTDDHSELLSLAQEACRQTRCPCPVLEAWQSQILGGEAAHNAPLVPPPTRGRRKPKVEPTNEGPSFVSRAVSLRERAWLSALLEGAKKSVDAVGIWTQHQRRLVEAEAAAAARLGDTTGQLRMPGIDGELCDERAIDEARLAVVIDDLVASGDLAVTGRGTKKRYKLVPRTARR